MKPRQLLLLLPVVVSGVMGGRAQVENWKAASSPDAFAITEPSAPRPTVQYTGPQPFDVAHYTLDLTIAMVSGDFGGKVTMTVAAKEAMSSLTLNEALLEIDSVVVDGAAAGWSIDSTNEEFTVQLPRSYAAGETLTVVITYRRPPDTKRPSDQYGYYYFVPDTSGLKYLPDTLGYTMSEPMDARRWMPCYDQPWDKATAEINATVPQGFVAASNGRLTGTTVNADGTITWHWKESHQIATYLLCVTVSKWTVPTAAYARAAADTVPVQYFVWPADSSKCSAYLPTVVAMIENLSPLFGAYPFDKYAMAGVTPFGYGGMEHQTMTTLHRSYVTDEAVVVHELAHQWWGDDVTCGTWKDIWLNESFASYAEALWQERVGGGATALRNYMINTHQKFYMTSWYGTIYDPAGQGYGYFPSSVYNKGAWVLHMLRGIMGDTAFFGGLRAYRTIYHGTAAVTDEFIAVMDSVSGEDLGWFFNEWIYGKGWPIYSCVSSSSGDSLTLTIAQTQNSEWPTFRMPLTIVALLNDDEVASFVVIDSLRSQSFRLPLSFTPDSIALDPENWVLKQSSMTFTSVNRPTAGTPATFELFPNYPNPFNPTTVISGQWTVDCWVKLVVYDVLGREVATLADGRFPAGRHVFPFDAKGLASGVYFCRMTAGSFVQTRKMILMQ